MSNRRDRGEQVPGVGDAWDPLEHIPDLADSPKPGSAGPVGARKPTDDQIYDEVRKAIAQCPGVDASGIEVMVSNGEVFLTGLVADRDQKRLVEEMAREVAWVRGVYDRLELVPVAALDLPSFGGASFG